MSGWWIWMICTQKTQEEAIRILTEEYHLSPEDAQLVYQENIARGQSKK